MYYIIELEENPKQRRGVVEHTKKGEMLYSELKDKNQIKMQPIQAVNYGTKLNNQAGDQLDIH